MAWRASLRYAAALVLLAGSGLPAIAGADRSPPPGGVYPLKPGIFVAGGASCAAPPNAAIRQYDGHGIGTAHTHACRARVLSRKGRLYTVSQSCIDAGVGSAPRFIERQTVTVHDPLTFTLTTRGPGTTYRYCPIDRLPAGLRPPR